MIDASKRIPSAAKHLWALGCSNLEERNDSGFTGSALKNGARAILAIELMWADGVDVKKYIDDAHEQFYRVTK